MDVLLTCVFVLGPPRSLFAGTKLAAWMQQGAPSGMEKQFEQPLDDSSPSSLQVVQGIPRRVVRVGGRKRVETDASQRDNPAHPALGSSYSVIVNRMK